MTTQERQELVATLAERVKDRAENLEGVNVDLGYFGSYRGPLYLLLQERGIEGASEIGPKTYSEMCFEAMALNTK